MTNAGLLAGRAVRDSAIGNACRIPGRLARGKGFQSAVRAAGRKSGRLARRSGIRSAADAVGRMSGRHARGGRLRPEDLEGGTFTVSNLGMLGVKHFEAIVNPPQAAILTAGAVRRVPVFDAYDRVIPGQLLTATVSADHRVTDGAEVAKFLNELKAMLEGGFALISAV